MILCERNGPYMNQFSSELAHSELLTGAASSLGWFFYLLIRKCVRAVNRLEKPSQSPCVDTCYPLLLRELVPDKTRQQ